MMDIGDLVNILTFYNPHKHSIRSTLILPNQLINPIHNNAPHTHNHHPTISPVPIASTYSPPLLYSSSLTASCHTVFPSPTTKCVITLPSSAPCQCVVPADAHTTSPVFNRCGTPPLSQIHPFPATTLIICPCSWVCQ